MAVVVARNVLSLIEMIVTCAADAMSDQVARNSERIDHKSVPETQTDTRNPSTEKLVNLLLVKVELPLEGVLRAAEIGKMSESQHRKH